MLLKFENISAVNAAEYYNDYTNTFFDNVRKTNPLSYLALKIAIKGMSTEAIAEVLEVQPAIQLVTGCFAARNNVRK